MEKMKVLFRKDKKDGTINAFFPEDSANYGMISCYYRASRYEAGWTEASMEYYWGCVKATAEEYADLLSELERMFSDDDIALEVKQRLYYKDVLNTWHKRY